MVIFFFSSSLNKASISLTNQPRELQSFVHYLPSCPPLPNMRFAIIAAVGAANLAMAQYSNSTGPTLPERAGDFKLFGCATSSSGFPGFQKVATTDDMSIDMCAASCPTKYMGVIGK